MRKAVTQTKITSWITNSSNGSSNGKSKVYSQRLVWKSGFDL